MLSLTTSHAKHQHHPSSHIHSLHTTCCKFFVRRPRTNRRILSWYNTLFLSFIMLPWSVSLFALDEYIFHIHERAEQKQWQKSLRSHSHSVDLLVCIILWDIQSRVKTINFHHCASISSQTAVMEDWDWDICIRRWSLFDLRFGLFDFSLHQKMKSTRAGREMMKTLTFSHNIFLCRYSYFAFIIFFE